MKFANFMVPKPRPIGRGFGTVKTTCSLSKRFLFFQQGNFRNQWEANANSQGNSKVSKFIEFHNENCKAQNFAKIPCAQH